MLRSPFVVERDEVRAVFFDAGYTLLCMDPPQDVLFLRVCDALGIAIDRSRLADAVARANVLLAPRTPASVPIPYSRERVDAFWIDYHRVVLSGSAVDASAVDRAEHVYRRFTEQLGWRVYDDVGPLLARLRSRGLALAIVSNWTGDLEDVLARIGLHTWFDTVIDSAHFGHEKPHPEIFAEAVRRTGIPVTAAVHVGDSVEHDVEGALSFGLRTVLLDRAGKYPRFDRAPRVSSLTELLPLL